MLIKKCLLLAGGLLALPAYIACQTAPTQLAVLNGGVTIDAAGSYYLGFDVTGDITISASNVILDLNGHLVTGSIFVSMDLSDIAIMNGFVTASSGIEVDTGCSNVHLSNITVRYSGTNNGITITDGTNITIKEVVCLGSDIMSADVDGLALSECSNAVVCNCVIVGDGSTGDGLSVADCQKILIQECRVRNCTNSFEITGSKLVTVSNCTAFSGSTGFFANANDNSVQLFNCIADNHDTAGFSIGSDGESVYLEECLAYNNTGVSGFSVSSDVAHVVKKCVAIANDIGFESLDFDADDPVRYIANYADGNSTEDYVPTTPASAPFREKSANDNTGDGIQFWRNAIALT